MNDSTARLNSFDRKQEWPNVRPRDAATLMIVDKSGTEPRILMGKRSDKHVFYPGAYVFPGGRVDPGDSRLAGPEDLHPEVMRKLLVDMKGSTSPNRARGLARAALRETFEETGVLIGHPKSGTHSSRSPSWRAFLSHGVTPSLDRLVFFARAITPPRRPRRYDTRFFCVDADAIAETVRPQDSELLALHWLTHDEAHALELPRITEVILDALFERLAEGGLPSVDEPVPYFFMQNGRFERSTL